MKKLLIVLMVLLMACGSLAGCGGTPVVPEGDDYEVNLDIPYDIEGTLKVGITMVYSEMDLINELIKDFNQVYPNVTVVVDQVADPFNTTLVGYWQAEAHTPGIMPDVLMSNSLDMHVLIESGILLNLQKYVDESVAAGLLDLNDFWEEYWILGQENFDGDQYILPRSADRVVTNINETIFNQVFEGYTEDQLPFTPIPGTYVPANGWTWTEFMDTLEVIRQWYDANGRQEQYLLDSYFNWEAVYNPIFRSFGADLVTEDGQAQVDTEEVSEALNFMYDLIEKRYVAPLGGQVQAGYHFGQGCMLFNSAPAERLYEELGAQNFRYNLTTFPLVTDELSTSYIGSGVGGYGISSISKNRDLAWAFLRFMISRDGQNALARGGLTTPSIRKDMENPAANVWGSALMEEGINMEAYTYGTEQCIVTDFFLRPGKSKIYADLQEAVTLLVGDALSGTRSQIGKTMEEIQQLMKYRIETAR